VAIVVPTVLATTPAEYGAMLARAEGLSRRVHVDICDGRFAGAVTINLAQVHANTDTQLDLHLMLQDPVSQLENALSLKPNLIIFHAEASGDVAGAMAHTQELGIKAGLGLLPQTSVEGARGLIESADHVLIFTGLLGHNGGQFQSDQLAKAAEVRAINPEAELSVDGGVNDDNAALTVAHGIDVLYVGSFLHQAKDPQAAFDVINRQIGATSDSPTA
jgi:ribulose-phosphate 3-epimerase